MIPKARMAPDGPAIASASPSREKIVTPMTVLIEMNFAARKPHVKAVEGASQKSAIHQALAFTTIRPYTTEPETSFTLTLVVPQHRYQSMRRVVGSNWSHAQTASILEIIWYWG